MTRKEGKGLIVRSIVRTVLMVAALTIPAAAHAQNFAISVKTSTLGISLEGIRSFGPRYNARIGYSYFTYRHNDRGTDYILDADITMSAASAMFDWFPFEGIFHLSGGAFINLNDVQAVMTPNGSHDVGGRTYTPKMLGSLTADVVFNRVSPYLGFGFGNANGTDSGFTFDVGFLYHGSPGVHLEAEGLLEPSTEQEPIIEDNISWFQLYPVISIGYVYKF